MLLFLRRLPNNQPNSETNNSNTFTLIRIPIRIHTNTINIRSPIPIRTCTRISTRMLLDKVPAVSRIPPFLRSRSNKPRRKPRSTSTNTRIFMAGGILLSISTRT
jgi:hypothetical protein